MTFELRTATAYKHCVSGTPAINASTRYCAVYGHPVRHSASPAMHNAALATLGLNWRYLAFDVRPDDLRTGLAGARSMGFIGLNLTVPHKLLAVDLVDELDVSAKTWGAVNTVRFEAKGHHGWQPLAQFDDPPQDIRSVGFNTDADAIVQSLREDLDLDPAGASILLLGAGGAGRVAALRLAAEKPAHLYLVNRTMAKAAAVADEIRSRFPEVKVTVGYPPATNIDLVLNATSLGLEAEDDLPLRDAEFPLRTAKAVYDMIYRPAETRLLQAAKAAGCRVVNGIGMLLYQGAKALELWTGQKAPIQVMRDALIKNVYG